MNNYKKTLAILLLAVMAGVLIYSAYNDSVTYDEGIYISAGYAQYLSFNAGFKDRLNGASHNMLNCEQPPLAKYIAGFPLLFIKPDVSDAAVASFKENNPEKFEAALLFAPGNSPDLIVFLSRIPFIFMTLLLGYFLFKFTRDTTGSDNSALVSLFFYCLCPNMIGNGHVSAMDLPLTFSFFFIVVYLYRYFEKPDLKNAVLIGVFLGLAFLFKFSSIIFFPVVMIMFFIRKDIITKKEGPVHLLIILAISCVIIILTYLITGGLDSLFKGLSAQAMHSLFGHRAYLNGEYSRSGWWYYLPEAFLLKTPLAAVLLFLISIILWIKSGLSQFKKYYIVILLPIIYFIFAMLSGINIGVRYVLPVYPFVFMAISTIFISNIFTRKVFKGFIVLTIIWYLAAFIYATPYQLSYFNEIVSTPERAGNYLVDSNIDWGQDIKRVRDFIKSNNISEPYLAAFTSIDPELYGIKYKKIPKDIKPGQLKGYVIISVHHLKFPAQYYSDFAENINAFSWLEKSKLVGRIGRSFLVYYVE